MIEPDGHPTGGGAADGTPHDTRYFGFQDAASRLGGFVRVTTDPDTSEAVTSVCLWLPDGRTALASDRATATATDTMVRTGGTRIRVNDPVEDVEVVHDGRVQVLEDPWELDEPVWPTDDAQAPAGPTTVVEHRLRYMFGSALYRPAGHPGRHAQLGVVAGTVQLGDFVWEVDGRGVRCRYDETPSQTPGGRWWIGAAIDDECGFCVTEAVLAGDVDTCGFVWEGTTLHAVATMQLETVITDDRGHPVEIEAVLADADGGTWQFGGRVRRTAPVESPAGTHALAALTQWTTVDGRVGLGTAHRIDLD